MTTKDPSKNKLKSFVNDCTFSSLNHHDQYNNLNLNNKNQRSNLICSTNSKSIPFERKKSENSALIKNAVELAKSFESQTKNGSWNKSVKSLKFENLNNYLGNGDKDKSEMDNANMKNAKNNKNSSTLSLHIAAYENSNDAIKPGSEMDGNLNKNGESVEKNVPDSEIKVENTLEFPRQQQPTKVENEPEISQFSASQKLFYPNGFRTPGASKSIVQQQSQQKNRCSSASDAYSMDPLFLRQQQLQTSSHGVFGDTFIMRSHQNLMDASWTEGKEIAEREHYGVSISFPFGMPCDVCKKRFGFTRNAVECRDCNLRFHRRCESAAPRPCIPKTILQASPIQQKSLLIDFCSSSHPYIPSIIIHCTIALEREHLDREGIYRISGTVSAVTKLLNDFLSSRVIPDLSNAPTENITGCIKKFLKELKDCVVPSTSYESFMQAIEEENEQQIINSIFELPAPNRDTLAYLILHLQKVARYSASNKMPIENLARVLAPTIIGYSKKRLPNKMVKEFTIHCNQTMILYRLLKLPSDFWKQFLTRNMSPFAAALSEVSSTASTPTPTSSPKSAFTTSTSSSPAGLGAGTASLLTSPTMPRSISSRFRRMNNNFASGRSGGIRGVRSAEEAKPPPKPSPLQRSLSLASSIVRSFRSAF